MRSALFPAGYSRAVASASVTTFGFGFFFCFFLASEPPRSSAKALRVGRLDPPRSRLAVRGTTPRKIDECVDAETESRPQPKHARTCFRCRSLAALELSH